MFLSMNSRKKWFSIFRYFSLPLSISKKYITFKKKLGAKYRKTEKELFVELFKRTICIFENINSGRFELVRPELANLKNSFDAKTIQIERFFKKIKNENCEKHSHFSSLRQII